MRNRIFLLLAIVLLTWSCNEENLDLQTNDVQSTSEENSTETLSDNDFVCSTLMPSTNDSISSRVSYKGTYWQRGQTIRIKFLNGSSYMQGLVRQYANEWTRYANLKFQWVGRYDYADIKITFDNNGKGGASRVGNQCKLFGQNTPTMWYHSLHRYNNSNKRRVVLHEFGHALGLGHEHQNPTVNISWNRQAVYNYYLGIGWTRQMVDENIFAKFSKSSHDYGYFDPKSIMMYNIRPDFTTNRKSYPINYNLSLVDMHSIGMMYPSSKTGSSRMSLYRYWNPAVGDHFYTNNWGEIGWAKYGYKYEQTLGYLEDKPSYDTYPLYRYYAYNTGDHFYTTNMNTLGDAKYSYIFEGLIGYIKRYQVPGSKAIYRYWNVRLGDHFYSTDYSKLGRGKGGWVYEGVIGYIMQK